jgi:hypothetical protein
MLPLETRCNNSVQSKCGSSKYPDCEDFFRNGGQLTLNLVGSAVAIFRPADAAFEASTSVYIPNNKIGSDAPIYHLRLRQHGGCQQTIYLPSKMGYPILQENTDNELYVTCGKNHFKTILFTATTGSRRL